MLQVNDNPTHLPNILEQILVGPWSKVNRNFPQCGRSTFLESLEQEHLTLMSSLKEFEDITLSGFASEPRPESILCKCNLAVSF